jgi:hypothetical protein
LRFARSSAIFSLSTAGAATLPVCAGIAALSAAGAAGAAAGAGVAVAAGVAAGCAKAPTENRPAIKAVAVRDLKFMMLFLSGYVVCMVLQRQWIGIG